MNLSHARQLACVGFAAVCLCAGSPAVAATAPNLGTAETFVVLGGSTVTNSGSSVLDGDLGVWPGLAITGFPPGVVNGTTHAGDAVALPPGLMLSSAGLLSGTPTTSGTSIFTITATDQNGCTGTEDYVLWVATSEIPTLSGWAMILLAGVLALAGFAAIRRSGMSARRRRVGN